MEYEGALHFRVCGLHCDRDCDFHVYVHACGLCPNAYALCAHVCVHHIFHHAYACVLYDHDCDRHVHGDENNCGFHEA